MVGLRTPDGDGALRQVVVPELLREAVESGLTCDEAVVVGLELVRGHVHLVALAVIDEHVPHAAVAHHLEVARVLVHVEDDLHGLLCEEVLEVDHLPQVHHGHGGFREQGECRTRRARDDGDRPGVRELGERRVPLTDLVHVHVGVGEIHDDVDRAGGCRSPLVHHLRDAAAGGAGAHDVGDHVSHDSQVVECCHDSPQIVVRFPRSGCERLH